MRRITKDQLNDVLEGVTNFNGDFYTDNESEEPPFRFYIRYDGDTYNCSYNDPHRFRVQVLCHECGGFIERHEFLVFNRYNPLENQWHIDCVKKIAGIE